MKNRKDRGCPSALELLEYTNGHLPEDRAGALKKHIDSCICCHETIENFKASETHSDSNVGKLDIEYSVPAHISKLAKQLTTKAFGKIKYVRPKEITFGQLWTTKASEQTESELQGSMPRIVVVLNGTSTFDLSSETIIVAPISLELEFQSQYDLRIFEDESPLSYEFMIEVWNQTTILVSQLKFYLGPLSETLNEDLKLLNQVYLGLAAELETLANRTGLPFFGENDPRAIFQVQEVEECAYLREPALKIISIAERTPLSDSEKLIDICFRRAEGTLYKSSPKLYQQALAAASTAIQGAWFLYARNKVENEEFVARFAYHLLQEDLRIIFVLLPQILENSKLLITAYDKSKAKLFSEVVAAKRSQSFVVSTHGRVHPEDIEELSISIVNRA